MSLSKWIITSVSVVLSLGTTTVLAQDNEVWSIPKPDFSKQEQRDETVRGKLRALPQQFSLPTSYIVGGSTASRAEYPEYAMLLVDGGDGFLYAICGGSLIDARKVLTAAHCIESLNASQLFVIPEFYRFSEISIADVVPLSSAVQHPSYSSATINNDIAVLTLSSSASSSKAVVYGGSKDSEGNITMLDLVGETSTVVGMGLLAGGSSSTPSTLQKVSLPIVSNSVCQSVWGSMVTSSMICAGGTTSGGIGACSGDSGGPLFTVINGQKVQAGVVSWGHEDCAQPGVYDAYARTSSLLSFVRQHAPGASVVYGTMKRVNIAPITSLLLD